MTSDAGSFIAPRHIDRFRMLRGTMAWRNGDADVLPLLAAECVSPADVDALILAAFDCLARVCDARLQDPAGYLASWAATEQALADAEMGDSGEQP
jgi:hypothetical protein